MATQKNLSHIGEKYGKLTLLKFLYRKKTLYYYEAQCDCGNKKIVNLGAVMNGRIISCGCYHREIAKKLSTKHNQSRNRIYHIYLGIKERCYNKNKKEYMYYGSRGIKLCDEWNNDFISFYKWSMDNGYNDKLSIDRINVNGDYEPNNCRWVSIKKQSRNKRSNVFITYKNKTQVLSDWSLETGIPKETLRRRYKKYNNLDIVFHKGNLNKRGIKNELL